MDSKTDMPSVNFDKDEKLKAAQVYKKYIETKNIERAIIAKQMLRGKRILFSGLTAVALGIYTYTIIRVKQESFLDDFEEPPRFVTPSK